MALSTCSPAYSFRRLDRQSVLREWIRLNNNRIEFLYRPYALTEQDRRMGIIWYMENCQYVSIPCLEQYGDYNCSIREIEDTRGIARFLLRSTHTFLWRTDLMRMLRRFCSSDEARTDIYMYINKLAVRFQAGYNALKEPLREPFLPNCVLPQIKRTLLLADPLAMCHFRLAGLMLLIIGEMFLSSNLIQFPQSTDRTRALQVTLQAINNAVSTLGFHVLSKWCDNSGLYPDAIDNALNDLRIWTQECGGFSDAHIAASVSVPDVFRMTPEKMKDIPFFDMYPDSHLPFSLNLMITLNNTFVTIGDDVNCLISLINHGHVVAANAKLLFMMTNLEWLMGYRYCSQYKVWQAAMIQEQFVEWDELAAFVYMFPEFDSRWFTSMIPRVIGSLQMASDLLVQVVNETPEPPDLEPALVPFRVSFLNLAQRFFSRVIGILHDPSNVPERPLDHFIMEQRAYLRQLVENRVRGVRRYLPALPQPTLQFGEFEEVVTTFDFNMDRQLYLGAQLEPQMFDNLYPECYNRT